MDVKRRARWSRWLVKILTTNWSGKKLCRRSKLGCGWQRLLHGFYTANRTCLERNWPVFKEVSTDAVGSGFFVTWLGPLKSLPLHEQHWPQNYWSTVYCFLSKTLELPPIDALQYDCGERCLKKSKRLAKCYNLILAEYDVTCKNSVKNAKCDLCQRRAKIPVVDRLLPVEKLICCFFKIQLII